MLHYSNIGDLVRELSETPLNLFKAQNNLILIGAKFFEDSKKLDYKITKNFSLKHVFETCTGCRFGSATYHKCIAFPF